MRLPDHSIYVTLSAAQRYGEATGSLPEQARRELTELLTGARLRQPAEPGRPALYRARSRQIGLDVSARVVLEGPLHVVVSVSVRDA